MPGDDPGSARLAVVLAAGMGTRMRAADSEATLAADQTATADAGLKALIPVGRPFLDYVLSGLADAGFTDVCLIIGPDADGPHPVRARYASPAPGGRLSIRFAVQPSPIGTANALLLARPEIGDQPFVILNGDNYYPTDSLRVLRASSAPATLAFSREGLVRHGAIPPDRVARYALLGVSRDGYLTSVIEKPDAATMAAAGDTPISLNVWRLDAGIFRACREVPASARGEFELPQAIDYAVRTLGMRIRSIPADAEVLDLSQRSDIPNVTARLRDLEVRF